MIRSIGVSFCTASLGILLFLISDVVAIDERVETTTRAADSAHSGYSEVPNMPHIPWSPNVAGGGMGHCGPWIYGPYASVQVNVNTMGCNIVGDAANGPSIAVDPTNPSNIVIGWRQFDTIESNFKSAGWAHSHDGGQSWVFPGSIQPEVAGSSPVVDVTSDGNFYYASCAPAPRLFRSLDKGVSWEGPLGNYVTSGHPWFAIDRTGGIGHGNMYSASHNFRRSLDDGVNWSEGTPAPNWFTNIAISPDGRVFTADTASGGVYIGRSDSARNSELPFEFEFQTGIIDIAGHPGYGTCGNWEAINGQLWVVCDPSPLPWTGIVYILGTVHPGPLFYSRVVIVRSDDAGLTWSQPVFIGGDTGMSGQWFGTMSVAPNGRIDVVWNDTRHFPTCQINELFYSNSVDHGQTWQTPMAVSPSFLVHDSLGVHYQMVSDETHVNVAYAATFNDEQDIYFLRFPAFDCNENGLLDAVDIKSGASADCNSDGIPDECSPDCDGNGIPDSCDTTPDFDGDGTPDLCDSDTDNDGIDNESDVCDQSLPGFLLQANGAFVGDLNLDCQVSLFDYSFFSSCFSNSGPHISRPSCAVRFGADGDSDIDLVDFANFQRVFSGP